MIKNTYRKSRKVKIQTNVVSKQFVKNGIDLTLVGAGQTLYASLEHARKRVKTDESYIAKGIKYRLDLVEKQGKQIRLQPRYALIEVILKDNDFWQTWIKQNEIFERTDLESDRPTIHRIDSNGHYELGNIAVLPRGEHQQEHAVPVALVTIQNGDLSFEVFKSKSATAKTIGVSGGKITNMAKCGYTVIDEATGVDTGEVAFTLPVKILEPTATEEERKAQCEAHGITYETAEKRAERNKRMLAQIRNKQ